MNQTSIFQTHFKPMFIHSFPYEWAAILIWHIVFCCCLFVFLHVCMIFLKDKFNQKWGFCHYLLTLIACRNSWEVSVATDFPPARGWVTTELSFLGELKYAYMCKYHQQQAVVEHSSTVLGTNLRNLVFFMPLSASTPRLFNIVHLSDSFCYKWLCKLNTNYVKLIQY